jgi:hypothetical protein
MLKHLCLAVALVLTIFVACTAQNTATSSVSFKELESYKKGGVTWRNIVVDKKIKRDDLIKLARDLHGAYPITPFRIFTDDEKFKEFMQRDIHYPDPSYTYPEAWAKKHYIAIINKMTAEGGMRWQLYPQGLEGMKFVAKDEPVIANL